MPRPPRNGERQKKTNSCFERCFGVKEPLSRISVRVKKKFTEKRRSRINSISENRELEHASVKSGNYWTIFIISIIKINYNYIIKATNSTTEKIRFDKQRLLKNWKNEIPNFSKKRMSRSLKVQWSYKTAICSTAICGKNWASPAACARIPLYRSRRESRRLISPSTSLKRFWI